MLQSTLKRLAANLLNTALPLEYILKQRNNRYILSYHRVVPKHIAEKYRMQRPMWISDDRFREDIAWFSRIGTLVDIGTILDTGTCSDRPLFSITFDDGWVDNYTHAFPILRELSIPATIFLVTNAVETGEIFWVEDFLYKIALLDDSSQNHAAGILSGYLQPALKVDHQVTCISTLAEAMAEHLKTVTDAERKRTMLDLYMQLGLDPAPLKGHILSWDQITEMQASGILFGSHTHNHVILQYADDDLIRSELMTSRDILRNRLGKEAEYFCYPNARYRPSNIQLIESAGYSFAFRMHNLPLKPECDRYLVPRFLLNEHLCSDRNILTCKLLGLPGFH